MKWIRFGLLNGIRCFFFGLIIDNNDNERKQIKKELKKRERSTVTLIVIIFQIFVIIGSDCFAFLKRIEISWVIYTKQTKKQ